jgi:O-antigen/teichoic acid export membrane protein
VAGRVSTARVAGRRHLTLAIGTFGSQVAAYVLLIDLSRRLGTSDYGELASLFTLVIIGTIPGLAYQLWIARTVVALRRDPDRGDVPVSIVRFTAVLAGVCTAGTAVAVLVLSPALNTALLPSLLGVSLAVPALVVSAALQGVLQGQDRVRALAAVILITGMGRLVGGVGFDLVHSGPHSALIGQGLGLVVAAAVSFLFLERPTAPADREVGAPTWLSVGRIVGAAGSIWVLSNIDLVLARGVLDHHTSGLYSSGALVTRAVQFAPQFLVVSNFALFASATNSRRLLVRASGQLLGIGLLATVGAAVFGTFVVPWVLGSAYREMGTVAWGFAVLGTLVAFNQLLLSHRIARHDERASVMVWLATGLFGVGAVLVPGLTWTGLLVLGCAVNLGLAVSLYARARAAEPAAARA